MRKLALALLLALASPSRGDPRSVDPGRGRYLFAPSAFLLRGGEVVAAQTELLFSSVSLGIGDHVNVLAGSAAPALMAAGTSAFNLALGLKAGFSPAEVVHLAFGFETLTLPTLTGGFSYGVVSIGRERLHLTIGLGLPVLAIGLDGSLGPPLTFAAGSLTLGRHVVLATENWWFPTRPELPMLNSGLVRFLVWRLSIGLGAAYVAPLRIPLPWIDLALRIGG
jgi:hypothetical protein